ncbi:unnamed protein product [Caenorhabditis nigoni]|uniref:Uncharacterized protein n=1 Tax=Caenorhabditis nigoni TaxID=1611254 RepID=A0A2G5SCS9_9PELO|nr:hypothetical protein B9Z55_028125 [Caenorhabditis nigoni]
MLPHLDMETLRSTQKQNKRTTTTIDQGLKKGEKVHSPTTPTISRCNVTKNEVNSRSVIIKQIYSNGPQNCGRIIKKVRMWSQHHQKPKESESRNRRHQNLLEQLTERHLQSRNNRLGIAVATENA